MNHSDKTAGQLLDDLANAEAKIAELELKQRRAEETLRVLKDNTARYLDLAEVILVALDEQARITMIGGSCYEILGYQPDELIGKNWFQVCLPPEDYDHVFTVYKNLISGVTENVEYYENDVLTKHGYNVHISWHNSLLKDESGNIIGTLSAGTDITERKKVEEMLRQNEAQFRSIIDASPVPYALNDDNQNITYLNPAFINTFGYDSNDIPTLAQWWPRAYPDPAYLKWVETTWQERLDKANRHNTPFTPLEVDIQCKDGSIRTVLASATAITKSFKSTHLVILYDITERKQAESALRDSERKYRQLFENMTSGFALHEIICDDHGSPIDYKYLELNPAFEKLTGVPTTALLGKTIREVLPETEDYWIETFGKVALTGESLAYENYSRELGKYYDTWVFSPQKNQFAVIFTDITERKQAEEKLRENDKQFQVLFAQSSFGVAKINSNTGEFVRINQRFCDLLGYSIGEMLQMDFKQITPPGDLQTDLIAMEQLRAGRVDQIKKEKRYIRKDGEIIWGNLSVLPLWEQGSPPDYHLSIVEDITERKKAEEKLQRQKDEQQQIINTMVDAVISINEQGAIQTFSNSAERMFGYSAAEIIDKNIKLLMPAPYAEQHDNYLVNYLNTREAHIIGIPREVSGMRKNGEIFPMRLSVAELPENPDGTRQFIGSCQDITNQKQQEEQLRRSQKMDALGKLTGGIAHDYNNMLGVILGYSQILQEELADNSRLMKFVDEINHASERGRKLSRKLLAFTRNKQPEAGVVDINKIIIAEQDLLQKTLTPRISLKMDLDKNVWPIYLDSSDLEDALLNLTINAMHAMETGGELTISTRNKLLGRREVINTNLTAGEYVEINVSDTGAGIDAETQEKIFDPFFTTKGDGGVGLGLSMVYGFVQRSGGDITVQSVPGQGASFVLYFPRFKQTVVSKPEISVVDDKELLGDESILVVDDEPAMLELMKEILAAKGYKVLTAKDGRAALDVLKREKIDLLVSDVIMPEMDGFELAAKIQDEYPATKIQLVSGFAENRHKIVEDPELNRRLLQKPFTAQVLRHRVREILDGHSQPKKINKPTIMVMDDEENVRELFRVNLEKLGYETVLVSNGEQAIGRYQDSLKSDKPIEAVIMDLQIQGGMDGLDAARGILAIDHRAKLIVSSGDSYGQVMSNFREHGFQAAIEKTFDRENMEKVITQVLLAK